MADQPDAVAVEGYAQMQTETLLNLASPQPMYREMIDQGGMASPGDGMLMVFNRELNDYVLRHHELFSSRIDMPLGNVRPLIPLNVDPPKHSKYRKGCGGRCFFRERIADTPAPGRWELVN